MLGDRDLLVTSTDVQTGDVAQPYVAGKWRLEGDIIVLHGKSRTDGPFWPAILHSVWSSPYRGYTGFRIDSNDGVTMRLSVVRWDARGNVVPQAPQTCTWMRVK